MSDPMVVKLRTFLDTEFAKKEGQAHPKLVFRGRDVVNGTMVAARVAKYPDRRTHSDRSSMAWLLTNVTQDGGDFAGYHIEVMLDTNRSRGAKYIAVRTSDYSAATREVPR